MEHNPYSPPAAPVADAGMSMRPARRPPEIARAVYLLLGSLGFGPINVALDWQYLRTLSTPGMLAFQWAFTVAIFVWLTLKIRAGRNWARITFLVLFILGVPFQAMLLPQTFRRVPISGVLQVVQSLMQFYVLYLLFTQPGRSWFERRKMTGASVA